jgi:hypothetical protein
MMRTLRLVIELDYDSDTMHGDEVESMEWFRDEVLSGGHLMLLDQGDLGDVVGDVRIIEGLEQVVNKTSMSKRLLKHAKRPQ